MQSIGGDQFSMLDQVSLAGRCAGASLAIFRKNIADLVEFLRCVRRLVNDKLIAAIARDLV